MISVQDSVLQGRIQFLERCEGDNFDFNLSFAIIGRLIMINKYTLHDNNKKIRILLIFIIQWTYTKTLHKKNYLQYETLHSI